MLGPKLLPVAFEVDEPTSSVLADGDYPRAVTGYKSGSRDATHCCLVQLAHDTHPGWQKLWKAARSLIALGERRYIDLVHCKCAISEPEYDFRI